jgi:hypothetical protein
VPKRKQDPNDDKVTGADIIAFIEEVCFIPEGRYVGKKFAFDWQKAEICRIYDNPQGTRRAILSMGRKNAKTTKTSILRALVLRSLANLPCAGRLRCKSVFGGLGRYFGRPSFGLRPRRPPAWVRRPASPGRSRCHLSRS